MDITNTTARAAVGLRDRRRRAGLTQQQLADLAGVSRSMLRLLESGYRPARSPARERVERALSELEAANWSRSGQQRPSVEPSGPRIAHGSGDQPGCDRLPAERDVAGEEGT